MAETDGEMRFGSLSKIDEVDEEDCTALHVALLRCNLDCASVLLENGADVMIKCHDSPVIHLALSAAATAAAASGSSGSSGSKDYANFAAEATKLLIQFGARTLPSAQSCSPGPDFIPSYQKYKADPALDEFGRSASLTRHEHAQ